MDLNVYRGKVPIAMRGFGFNVEAVVSYLNIGAPTGDDEFGAFELKAVKMVNQGDAFFLNLDKESDSLTFKVLGF